MAMQAQRGLGGIDPTHSKPGTRRNGWSAPCSGHFTPKKDPVSMIGEEGWASELVCIAQKILQPQAFHPQTVQPIVSHHNDHYPGCQIKGTIFKLNPKPVHVENVDTEA